MNELSSALLAWYEKAKRRLPWRDSFDPYRVWVSEIMLQQTRVDTVIPYFQRFMADFPNIKILAEAEEEHYLKLWEGLGYYSRVRNLVKGAKMIQEEFLGVMPEDKVSLMKIPGIGDYTSNAILAFAFGEPVVTVDGNLIRVYARLAASSVVPNDASSKKLCEDYFLPHVTKENSRDFNQALMDLGELICLPNGEPRCLECPLARFCKAHQQGEPTKYPLPKKKVEKRAEVRQVFLLIHDNKVMLWKRSDKGLLGGMYEFLNVQAEENANPEKTLQKLDIFCKTPIFIGKKKHIFTHLIWDMDGYVCYLDKPIDDAVSASRQDIIHRYTLPNAFSYFVEILFKDYLK